MGLRLTRDHIADSFPTIGALGRLAEPAVFTKLLAAELGAFTDNLPYAEDMAVVLMSHIDNGLFSDLPPRLVPYRATLDIFLSVLEEQRVSLYIRSIALALRQKKRPATFRKALCGRSNEFKIRVPKHLFDDFGADRFSKPIRTRVPYSVESEVKMRAKSFGISISEYLREALYARMQLEDGAERRNQE